MSVERLVLRALFGTVTARLLSTTIDGTSGIIHAAARILEDAADAVGYVESHFGREYEKLSGQDLAELLGSPGLYEGVPQTEEVTAEGDDEEE